MNIIPLLNFPNLFFFTIQHKYKMNEKYYGKNILHFYL